MNVYGAEVRFQVTDLVQITSTVSTGMQFLYSTFERERILFYLHRRVRS